MEPTATPPPQKPEESDEPLDTLEPVPQFLPKTETPPIESQPPESTDQNETTASTPWRRRIIQIAIFCAAVLLLILFITHFVLQIYEVDGPSMQTTLQNHDELIVDKFPKTVAELIGHTYIPKRGDIIIISTAGLNNFFTPLNVEAKTATEKFIVKRVIGLPGDRVVIKDGIVTVYDKQHPNGFRPDATLPYGKVIKTTSGNIDLVVPNNDVYVLGDNRPVSYDSRYFGPVPAKDIVGKVDLRVYPLDKLSIL